MYTWASAHRGKLGQLTPWKNGWKIKKRKHAIKSSFLCLCYILRATGADRCRERRYADHIFIQISFRMHHFVVKFSKLSSTQAARVHWPSYPKSCRRSCMHKTPIHSPSWECCNKTFQCLISKCPNFRCDEKIIIFLLGTLRPLHSGTPDFAYPANPIATPLSLWQPLCGTPIRKKSSVGLLSTVWRR